MTIKNFKNEFFVYKIVWEGTGPDVAIAGMQDQTVACESRYWASEVCMRSGTI